MSTLVSSRPLKSAADLPLDLQEFFGFAVSPARTMMSRLRDGIRDDLNGYQIVATELGCEIAVAKLFLQQAALVGLLKLREGYYLSGKRLPDRSAREIRTRCRRVVIDPRSAPGEQQRSQPSGNRSLPRRRRTRR